MKNNKKGFTLIELLAVIIILAVIALIAMPIVLNVVENARKQSNKNSAYGLLDAAKLYYTESLLDINKQSNINGTTNLINEIKVSGKKPDSGEIYINKSGQSAIAVIYDDVCYIKNFEESKITESNDIDNCTINSVETPQVLKYYAFGLPSTSSTTNFQDVITSSGSNVFVQKEGEQLSVCIYRNNTLECFKNNNYEEENTHLQNVFGVGTCGSFSSGANGEVLDLFCGDFTLFCLNNDDYDDYIGGMHCKVDDFYCIVDSEGNVNCNNCNDSDAYGC